MIGRVVAVDREGTMGFASGSFGEVLMRDSGCWLELLLMLQLLQSVPVAVGEERICREPGVRCGSTRERVGLQAGPGLGVSVSIDIDKLI